MNLLCSEAVLQVLERCIVAAIYCWKFCLSVYYSRDIEILDTVEILTESRDLKIFVGTDRCCILLD